MVAPMTLLVAGREYVDYVSATVSYGLDAFARSFAFDFSDKWLRSQVRNLPWGKGDACQIYVYDELVVDGFVSDLPIEYDAVGHSVAVAGRSWTGHMVDASAIHKSGAWYKAGLETIAADLAEPFGIAAAIDPWAQADASELFRIWAIEDEESAFECLQRACEQRGLFPVSDAGRNAIVTKAGPAVHDATLELGVNILRGRRVERWSDRFSEYIVKGQDAGSDEIYGDKVCHRVHRETDPLVTMYRPLILSSGGEGTYADLRRRAAWERNVRAGRSERYTYSVQGLRSPAGVAWPTNEQVQVIDGFLDVDDMLLLANVRLRVDANAGETATLELAQPEGFDVLAPPRKTKRKQKAGQP